MCCFSGDAKVAGTKIFARPSKDNGQFLVYSMMVTTSQELAMILPIPTPADPKEDAVTFINLEKYTDFFDELDAGFPVDRSNDKDAPTPKKDEPLPKPALKVIEVGSFVASFVPTIKDFSRLDKQFRLADGVWEKLPQYKNYGFAVFKLKKGEQKVHPMAFDFPRADKSKLFFPTVHIHDGKVHPKATFDHVLYCQGADTMSKWRESPQPAELFMGKLKEAKGIVSGKDHVYRSFIIGSYSNEDVWVG